MRVLDLWTVDLDGFVSIIVLADIMLLLYLLHVKVTFVSWIWMFTYHYLNSLSLFLSLLLLSNVHFFGWYSGKIVELWTKRNFRCDCGNSKFGEFFCKLFPNKDVENTENSYNHNFKGSYCTCGRPYPDPEAEEQVEMIQCCICEDWFHEEHLGLESSNEVVTWDVSTGFGSFSHVLLVYLSY